jgi:antitoxin (DNA-binding transcriptional repressor) of toxin-antitoxin stability system
MKFATISQFSSQTARVLRLVEKSGKVIITKRGKPCYLVERMDQDDLEDLILAQHLDLGAECRRVEREERQGRTVALSDLKIGDKRQEIKNKSGRKPCR